MNDVLKRLLLIVPLMTAVAACDDDDDGGGGGGGGGSGGGGGGETVAVSGTVVDGPVDGATVTAFALGAIGADGESLGEATTAADGSFTLKINVPEGAIRIRSIGGTYASEAETTKTYTGSDLSVLLETVPEAGLDGVAVTPLTTIVDARTTALLAGSSTTAKAFGDASGQAEDEVKTIYGFPADAPRFSALVPDFLSGSGNGAKLGLVIGAFQELGRRLERDPGKILRAIAEDIRDGNPDGQNGENPISFGEGDPAPGTLATSDFLGALSSYIDPNNTMTILAENEVDLDDELVSELRGAIVEVAPPSVALQIGSSGAVTVVASNGQQIVYVAARERGIKGIDVTDPDSPVLLPLTDLNVALAAVETPNGGSLANVGGVISVPGAATPQVILYSYTEPMVVLADVSNQTVLAAVDLSEALTSITGFSGGSAYISSGVPDPTRGVVWLATGDGYFPFDYSTFELGEPIALVNDQLIAENIGGDTGADLLFSPNYGVGFGGGLQLVNLLEGQAYSMDDDQFQDLFGVPYSEESSSPFGIADAGAVDSIFKVGVVTGEDTSNVAIIQLGDMSKFVFDTETATFTSTDDGIVAVMDTSDSSGYPTLAGSAVESQNHLVLFMAGYSTTIMVGKLDDPANPEGETWVGMTDWAFYDAPSSEYRYSRDPHAVGVIQALSNGRSYGFLLSDEGAVIMVDMQAFLDADRSAGGQHLAATPFDGETVKKVAFDSGTPAAGSESLKRAQQPPEVQRGYGFTYQR